MCSPIFAARDSFVLVLGRAVFVLCRIVFVLSLAVVLFSCCVVLSRVVTRAVFSSRSVLFGSGKYHKETNRKIFLNRITYLRATKRFDEPLL